MMQIKTKIKKKMKRYSAGYNVTVIKADIDFQIDKKFETSERNQFFHPSIKASATDYQWTPSGQITNGHQWTD